MNLIEPIHRKLDYRHVLLFYIQYQVLLERFHIRSYDEHCLSPIYNCNINPTYNKPTNVFTHYKKYIVYMAISRSRNFKKPSLVLVTSNMVRIKLTFCARENTMLPQKPQDHFSYSYCLFQFQIYFLLRSLDILLFSQGLLDQV